MLVLSHHSKSRISLSASLASRSSIPFGMTGLPSSPRTYLNGMLTLSAGCALSSALVALEISRSGRSMKEMSSKRSGQDNQLRAHTRGMNE